MSEAKLIEDVRRGKTSASNAEADELCARRHLAQIGLPDTAENDDDANAGKRMHKALFLREPQTLTSATERDTYFAFVSIEDKLVEQFFGADANAARSKVFREERYWVKIRDANNPKGDVFEHSGQPDVVYRHGTRALILEYKALRGDIPESPQNMQLRDQAVLTKGHFVLIDEVGAAVIQPGVTHDPKICIYNKAALAEAERRMFARVRASNNPNAIATAGDAQCKFCRAKLHCQAYQKFAGAMVPGMLNILDVAVTEWTPAQRAIFCEKVSIAEKWIETCKKEIKRVLTIDPDAVPGFGLSEGRRTEKISKPLEVFGRFAKLGGTQDQFLSAVDVGKMKLKDRVSEVTGARGKVLDEAMKTLLEGCVDVSISAPSLKKL